MASTYPHGQRVRVTGTFTVGGTAADPTLVTVRVKDPGGTVTDYVPPDVVNDSTGVYHLDVTADRQGDWHYRFVGSGAVIAAGEGMFVVSPSEFD